ncbi:DUF3365 domain-containing protein [Altererythrobacter sp. KTW20L]|uniref:c-type heme family protein n=1 Tax=Altererythrobacter sp. KTW20L TaxID=2942210 RepID=UPI0020C1046D|nr:DUF3365 domain-containing protein [Altererythrobacter sp. KTW20L]MCL6250441.1 DUF3365 domain-containing protein [Altererythrobacter sp. KTW20L]
MKPTGISIVAMGAGLALSSCATVPPPSAGLADADLASAGAIADQFQQRLSLQLITALREGGPVAGIEVCAEQAPAIAAALSQETGSEVRRISLAPRNPAAMPEAYLQGPLRDLQARPLDEEGRPRMVGWIEGRGADARQLTLRSVVMLDQPCGVCHGKDIAPDVQAAIDRHYPADVATGFSAGELRGAILVARNVASSH